MRGSAPRAARRVVSPASLRRRDFLHAPADKARESRYGASFVKNARLKAAEPGPVNPPTTNTFPSGAAATQRAPTDPFAPPKTLTQTASPSGRDLEHDPVSIDR